MGQYGLLRVFQQNYCAEDLCDVLFLDRLHFNLEAALPAQGSTICVT